MEITVELGEFLSVPNEAIIEEGDRRVVYVEEQKGKYVPHEIKGGFQGELYTEILSGLKEGDQVVTFGSFFIDSEYKLKLADQAGPDRSRMIVAIIRNIIRFRFLVFSVIGAGILLSFYAIQKAPLDAIPDISDPQIVIYVKWPRSPQLIETEVVEPLMRALIGSSDIQSIRGTSHMGYSFIYVILKEHREGTRCSNWCWIGSTRSGLSCRRMPASRWAPTPAAWVGSISTRWSTTSRRTICANCVF